MAQGFNAIAGIFRLTAYARTYGRGSHIHYKEIRCSLIQMLDLIFQNGSKASEGLAQSHWHRILKLCTSHLHDIGKLHALEPEAVNHLAKFVLELKMREIESEMTEGWIGIIGTLAAVHVIIRLDIAEISKFVTQNLQGAVGYHLVGIHVCRSAGTALNHVYGEGKRQLAVIYFTASLHHCIIFLRIQ